MQTISRKNTFPINQFVGGVDQTPGFASSKTHKRYRSFGAKFSHRIRRGCGLDVSGRRQRREQWRSCGERARCKWRHHGQRFQGDFEDTTGLFVDEARGALAPPHGWRCSCATTCRTRRVRITRFVTKLSRQSRPFSDSFRDTPDTPTASQTTNSGLGDALDVLLQVLAVTLGAALAQSFASFTTARHDYLLIRLRLEKLSVCDYKNF